MAADFARQGGVLGSRHDAKGTQIVSDANDRWMGGDVAGEGDAGSPGSGGASPYPEFRPTSI
jgi:hypothetical protein